MFIYSRRLARTPLNPISSCDNRFFIFRSSQKRIGLLRLDLFNDTSGISSNHVECRDVFGHDTSSTNRDTSTDGDIWAHGDISTKPAILANSDCTSKLRSFDAVTEKRVERMCGSEEGAARTNERASADGDYGGIEKCAVEVDVHTLADPGFMSTRQGRVWLGLTGDWFHSRL